MIIILNGTNIRFIKISITFKVQDITDISRLIISILINTANITIVITVYITINDANAVNITRFMVNTAEINSTLSIKVIIIINIAKIYIQNDNGNSYNKIYNEYYVIYRNFK